MRWSAGYANADEVLVDNLGEGYAFVVRPIDLLWFCQLAFPTLEPCLSDLLAVKSLRFLINYAPCALEPDLCGVIDSTRFSSFG